MKPIRVFSHATSEPPGYVLTLLERLQYPYELVCLEDGKSVPMDLHSISALIFMGGVGNVNDPTTWMVEEMQLIQQAKQQGVPILGICLGAQLMSKALGGKVWQSDHVEVGWHAVELLSAASGHPWFSTLPQKFTVFQWHAHVFSPPPGAYAMVTSACTECQAFTMDNNLAIQFHLEMDENLIDYLTQKFSSDLTGDSDCVQSREEIMKNMSAHCSNAYKIADKLLQTWMLSVLETP